MPWYSAHAILYVKFKDGNQNCFPVWENIYLISAVNGDEARANAIKIAESAEGDCQGTFMWEDRPAEWVLAGIRKVLTVSHASLGDSLASGDELTYSELSVPDEASLRRLVNGESAIVKYTN